MILSRVIMHNRAEDLHFKTLLQIVDHGLGRSE